MKGSHAVPYKQLIAVKWSPEFELTSIVGRCSCPIGYNCKHVAAALLEYQQRLQAKTAPLNPTACFDWLESLDADCSAESDPNQEFLAYLLKPQGAKQGLTVDFVVTKAKKSGGLTRGRAATLNNLIYSSSYGYRTPEYIQPEDEDIIKLLTGLANSHSYQPQIKGWTGGLVLNNMLQTGRLYWQNLDRPPLIAGVSRALAFQWRQNAAGDFLLAVEITPAAKLIYTDPPSYVDSQQGMLGQIDCPQLSTAQLRKLASAPPVPAKYAEEFSQRLIMDYPHLQLPPPQKIAITELDALQPQPRLTLQGRADQSGHVVHQLQLAFDYGDYTLSAYQADVYSSLRIKGGYVRIHRDLSAEQQCIAAIQDAGFEIIDDPQHKDLLFYSPGKTSADGAERWRLFQQNDVPELALQGWLIRTDPSFKLNFQHVDQWQAEIEEGQNNWFQMHFNIDINGVSMPLLPLLMPVIENYELAHLPQFITVPVGDYDYLTIACEKIKPMLAVLYEVFGNLSFGENGALKLSRFDAAGLADLESHSYGLFSLRGGEALRELGRKIQNFTGVADVALPENLNATLRHYQQQGLNWLQFLREYQFGGILADDMGLGKTVQTLAHLLLEKQSGRMRLPSLIIAPTSLMSNWRREAERFTPDLRLLVLQGAERKQLFDKIQDYDLVLTTYPLLPRDEEFLLAQKYYYLILDEAQIVKNPSAKAARTVRAITAEHRLCLTGTPMENHLGELWTQFDFLMPGFLGDNASFKRSYRTPIEIHGDSEQGQRLSKRIAPFMLRRTKREVVAELPPKSEIICAVPLGEKQAMLYETIRLSMEKRVREAIAERGLARSHITILDALLKLRQTCCDPRTLPLAEAKKVKESAKLELLLEMLPELLEEGHRILVFSQFTRMIALIEAELDGLHIAYSKLTGQTKNRDEAIERFKSGAANVFLISLKAGGVGLNLTEADTVIVYDPWWNPAVESQAADRAHRIGQDKPVFVYKLITENTVEEKIIAMQDRKRALAAGVYNGGKQDPSAKFTAEDLRMLFEPL